jgi:bacteriocin biosynthesis cyclodehydratase domain-containing protein
VARLTSAVVLRSDVRLWRSEDYVYVCSSNSTPLRLRLDHAGSGSKVDVDLADLTDAALSSLIRRGLLVPADDPLLRHPSFPKAPGKARQVHVVGEDQLCMSITAALTNAGLTVVSNTSSLVGVVVLPLCSSEDVLRTVAKHAVHDRKPMVIYASAAACVYYAVLHPPRTACPLCLARRIRASRPDRALGVLPLEMLLGACSDSVWPSSAAAAGLIAHQVIRAITNPESVEDEPTGLMELNLDTCDRIRHPLLHTPFCPVCHKHLPTSPELSVLEDRPAISAEETWQRMQRAVDPLTGIVAGIRVIAPEDTDSTVGSVTAWARGGTDTRWFSPVRSSTVGGSTKYDPLNAQVCALGELLERYSAGIYDPVQFIRASLSELGPTAVDPRSLPLGSVREYELMKGKLVPYHPDMVIDWVEGVALDSGERRYVPACAVYVPYQAPHKNERLLNPISTGLAAGSTPAQAIRGGLQEVLERDAAAIFWYNRLSVPTIDWQSLPPGTARTVLDGMHSRGIELIVKDITTDIGIPAVVVLGRFQTAERPVALCGFRADVDPYECLVGAAQELEHVIAMYWRFTKMGGILDETAEPRDVWDFATYYCHESRAAVLDFMYDGPCRLAPTPPPEPLSDMASITHIVDRLFMNGYQAITVDITPIDVTESGISVFRVVVPGLQPVAFFQKFRRLGGRRVYATPVRMGLRNAELSEQELNSYPIPMG